LSSPALHFLTLRDRFLQRPQLRHLLDARLQLVQSWDIAAMTGETNDYSVCTTWCMRR
jgi:phage terminase large subunit-like protein